MKNIQLIITLLISWNVIAEEKVWYCTPDSHIGLNYEKDTMRFEVSRFSNVNRVVIKQYGSDILTIPKDSSFGAESYDRDECSALYGKIISCSDRTSNFNLNTKTGYATSSKAFGWIMTAKDEAYADDMVLVAWKCESF